MTPAAAESAVISKREHNSGFCVSQRLAVHFSCGHSLPLIAAHSLYVKYRSLTCVPLHLQSGCLLSVSEHSVIISCKKLNMDFP